ncbi:MAG TPA: M1 family aminopeptidase [Chitinophagaceae bacterium]|nr:M1 family aminopeptidase [Chitinophagaceae bacterium]
MKKFLLLATLLPLFAHSQETGVFRNEQAAIAESERKAAERLMSASRMESVASGNYNVHHYRCEWQLDPAVRYIRGTITTSFSMIQPGNSITFDLANQLVVDSVVYHGNKITFSRLPNNGVVLNFPAPIATNAKDSVSIFYQGNPAGGGFGAFHQGTHGAGVPVIWTLSEPYGAKDWWPCKDGLDDKADSIDIIMRHPAIYTSSSNGMMISRQTAGSDAVTHFRHRYPIATYLVAIAVTNYVVRNDTVRVDNKVYPFISYAYPENAGSFFNSEYFAKDAYRIFTKLFGEYPFANEKYGHTQFGWGGGMEHQTNSFMFNTSPNLSAHELGHQWFGNKITCGSWQHIWLNEGFATYSTALFLEHGFPTFFRPFLQSTLNSVVSQPAGSVFVPDTTNPNRIFDGRLSYNKGCYVVHMLRWVLGDSTFYRGIRQYLEDPSLRYGFAKTADLQRNLEQVSGKNLGSFFQKWVYGEGYPNYHADWYQSAGSPWISVKLNQTTSHNSVSFYDMPVMLEFRNATQSVKVVADHRYSGQVFSFNAGFAVDTVLIDPDIWILSKTKTSAKSTVDLLPPDDIQLYPNPSPGDATFRLRNATGNRLSLRLFNAAGQLLFRRDITTAPGAQVEVLIPFNQYPRGVYMLQIQNDRDLKLLKRIVH